MKSGKFQAGKFVPAIKKYLVNEAIDGYYHEKGAHKNLGDTYNDPAGTKNVIAAYISKDIMAEAKRVASSGQKCRAYVSPEAKRWGNMF